MHRARAETKARPAPRQQRSRGDTRPGDSSVPHYLEHLLKIFINCEINGPLITFDKIIINYLMKNIDHKLLDEEHRQYTTS